MSASPHISGQFMMDPGYGSACAGPCISRHLELMGTLDRKHDDRMRKLECEGVPSLAAQQIFPIGLRGSPEQLEA